MYKTKVISNKVEVANKEYEQLKTTIPKGVVVGLALQKGSELEWREKDDRFIINKANEDNR